MKFSKRNFWMLGLFLLAQGCSHCYECIDDHMTAMYDRRDAKRSWVENRTCFVEEEYQRDFRDGYLNGYYDVMQGGGQCLPTLPPRKYWSVHNRGPDASCRITAWFNGYSQGTLRATSDGVSGRGRILTSAQIYGMANCPTCPPVRIDMPESLIPGAAGDQPIDPLLELPAVQPSPAMVPPAELPVNPEPYMPKQVDEPPALRPVAPPAQPNAAQLELKQELFGDDAEDNAPAKFEAPVSVPEAVNLPEPVKLEEPVTQWAQPIPLQAVVTAPAAMPLTEVLPAITPRQPVAPSPAPQKEVSGITPLVQHANVDSEPQPAFQAPIQMISVQDVAAERKPDIPAVITLPPTQQPGKARLPQSMPAVGRVMLPGSR